MFYHAQIAPLQLHSLSISHFLCVELFHYASSNVVLTIVLHLYILQMGTCACPLSQCTPKGKTEASKIAPAIAETTINKHIMVVTTNILRFTCLTHVLAKWAFIAYMLDAVWRWPVKNTSGHRLRDVYCTRHQSVFHCCTIRIQSFIVKGATVLSQGYSKQ